MATITERVLRAARAARELETAARELAGVLTVARLQSDEVATVAEAIARGREALAELRRLLPPTLVLWPCVGCGRRRADVQTGRRHVTIDALCGPCYASCLDLAATVRATATGEPRPADVDLNAYAGGA